METPELPGPLLRGGKVDSGSVPTARCPGPGSSTEKSKCSSIPSPSPCTPACPKASGPRLLQPRGVRASLGPHLQGVCHQPQGEDTGQGPQGSRGVVGAPCACSPACPAPLESPLGGAAPRPREAASGSAEAAWAPSLRARGSGMGVPLRSAKLGPPGVHQEHWVCRCEGVSALGMRASDGGTQLGDPVCWLPATGVQMGLPALS